jgi:hypothetical protein
MKKPPQKFSTAIRIACAIMMLFVSVLPALLPSNAFAAQITNRSATLVGVGTDGGTKPSGVVNHLFSFTLPTSQNVGSIKFEYCTTAANSVAVPACVTPTGLSTTSSAFGAQTGLPAGGGWSIDNTTQGKPYIKNTSAQAITGPQAVTVRLDTVTNPSAANGETFYIRITTYSSLDTTGGAADAGTVAAATNRPIILTGTMPESLVFCTGETVGLTGGVPDCATITTGSVTFDKLFSPVDTAVAMSQMAASTNAGSGYVITINGTTMTSGSNTITGMTAAAASVKGTSQFGLNLMANTSAASASFPGTLAPYLSADVAPAANGTNYRGQPFTGYGTVDQFKFQTGDAVAKSDNSAAGPSDAQIFTASYIVNVPGSQPAGTYTTTLTYICTATF